MDQDELCQKCGLPKTQKHGCGRAQVAEKKKMAVEAKKTSKHESMQRYSPKNWKKQLAAKPNAIEQGPASDQAPAEAPQQQEEEAVPQLQPQPQLELVQQPRRRRLRHRRG